MLYAQASCCKLGILAPTGYTNVRPSLHGCILLGLLDKSLNDILLSAFCMQFGWGSLHCLLSLGRKASTKSHPCKFHSLLLTFGSPLFNILPLRNVSFFGNERELNLNDPWLEYASCVSINFEWQKKDRRMVPVTQMASVDVLLYPVHQWAAAIQRIGGHPGATDKKPILLL